MKQRVLKAFTTPANPASFTSVRSITRHHFKRADTNKVRTALEALDSYTRHKTYDRRFTRRKTQTWGVDKQWQVDLIDMQNMSKHNDGVKYILVGVDVFSRYAFAQPVRTKSAANVLEAFKQMTESRQPRYIQSDKGVEFTNKLFQTHLRNRGISFFTSENDDIKCAIVERLNGTLQRKLWGYFTENNTFRFVDVLSDIVHSYNNTHHSVLGCAPSAVNAENSELLFYRLYERLPKARGGRSLKNTPTRPKYKPGDDVRILQTRKTFNRGYEPNWTQEIFTIHSVKPLGYELHDAMGEQIKGVFYEAELQRVSPNARRRYTIERVLKHRGRGKNREALVKWQGYGEKFNSWEPARNIKKWRSQ